MQALRASAAELESYLDDVEVFRTASSSARASLNQVASLQMRLTEHAARESAYLWQHEDALAQRGVPQAIEGRRAAVRERLGRALASLHDQISILGEAEDVFQGAQDQIMYGAQNMSMDCTLAVRRTREMASAARERAKEVLANGRGIEVCEGCRYQVRLHPKS